MQKLNVQTTSLFHQTLVELRLFWRTRQAVYLNFFVPMLGMALFIYLDQEGMLERFYGLLSRGLGAGGAVLAESSPMALMTVGLITYCIITVAFEGLAPHVVRQRDAGIFKRLGGTPLRKWVFLTSKALSASVLVFIEAALIFVVGLVFIFVAVRLSAGGPGEVAHDEDEGGPANQQSEVEIYKAPYKGEKRRNPHFGQDSVVDEEESHLPDAAASRGGDKG